MYSIRIFDDPISTPIYTVVSVMFLLYDTSKLSQLCLNRGYLNDIKETIHDTKQINHFDRF